MMLNTVPLNMEALDLTRISISRVILASEEPEE